jgi:uncharacterized protein
MTKFLIHIHTGPADATKVTLGMLIAATALKEGHEVDVFLAGDAVHLLAEKHVGLEGLGTGRLGDHLSAIGEAGGRFYVSRMSAAARGYDDGLITGRPAEFALPSDLVRLAAEAERTISY